MRNPECSPQHANTIALPGASLHKWLKLFLPGMALTAQIKLQQRTILQLVFSRFNQGLDAVRTLR